MIQPFGAVRKLVNRLSSCRKIQLYIFHNYSIGHAFRIIGLCGHSPPLSYLNQLSYRCWSAPTAWTCGLLPPSKTSWMVSVATTTAFWQTTSSHAVAPYITPTPGPLHSQSPGGYGVYLSHSLHFLHLTSFFITCS